MSTLRTFRVLRPLNLVSGVPSKHYFGLGLIPRLKSTIRTASAICWNYLGLFRSATAKALLDVAALRLRLRSYFLGVKFVNTEDVQSLEATQSRLGSTK